MLIETEYQTSQISDWLFFIAKISLQTKPLSSTIILSEDVFHKICLSNTPNVGQIGIIIFLVYAQDMNDLVISATIDYVKLSHGTHAHHCEQTVFFF